MWNRKDLKMQAKAAVKRNYWKSIVVGVIDVLALGGAAAATQSNNNVNESWNQLMAGVTPETVFAFLAAMFGIFVVVMLVGLVINALLFGPLRVGSSRFKISALQGVGSFSELGSGFDANYKHNVKTMFLTNLYITLWSFVLVIPGVVKSYEYRMVPYILAENHEMPTKEVLAKSKAMMQGNKWNAFVLDLSFILWDILSAATFDLVGLFYVQPYKSMTDAALYEAVKNN